MGELRKCPSCGDSGMQRKVTDHYHFPESGLDNVFLLKPEIAVCARCGEEILMLPEPSKLLRCLGKAVIFAPGALSAKEIRFLRKDLGLKSSEFANCLGVNRGTVSRWENGEKSPEPPTDRLIRMVYASKLGEKVILQLLKHFEEEDSKLTKSDLDYFVSVPECGFSYSCDLHKSLGLNLPAAR